MAARTPQELPEYIRIIAISDTTERNAELADFWRYISYFMAWSEFGD
tara:strand:- start:407 stop:547 length:141 start_codon:yes stop_codon:yes gene_type:complete